MPLSPKSSSDPASSFSDLLTRADALLARIEALLPKAGEAPDWEKIIACRWKKHKRGFIHPFGEEGRLIPVHNLNPIRLADLSCIEEQKTRIVANTQQFIRGYAANNALLTGTRGSGKSSLIKALLNEFSGKGLRLIEVDKEDLADLADIIDQIATRPEKFILFCDDLSFEAGESAYKALKSALDGSIAVPPDNVLIYATSNRRHLIPEYFSENLEGSRAENGEIHPGETVEEKISLSERFGLWVSFYPFSQEDYLAIVRHWLASFGFSNRVIQDAERDALNWALSRGSRSGRVAWQFALDFAGHLAKNTKSCQNAGKSRTSRKRAS
ncbi:MAG: ATP-binding protein [Zoogloeaceae bacterium]|jgi:predicted AAA+ superfamily ATPase|nr:ATP-binding protein [Zoogloeaceae bacterium]